MNQASLSLMGTTAVVAAALLVGGCAMVGPDFKAPTAKYPAYRHAPAKTIGTAPTAPAGGAWWTVFGDAALDGLEYRALAENPSLASSAHRVEAARAELGVARADARPSVTASGTATLASQSATHTIPVPGHSLTYRTRGDSYDLGFGASYELDFWGRVRRSLESASAQVAASQADERAAQLLLCTDLAQTYFLYRELEREEFIVTEDISAQNEAIAVMRERQRGGLTTDLDIQRADTELAVSEADAADLGRRRAQAFDALAVLTGRAPSELEPLVRGGVLPAPPDIPPGLPSETLLRRPDVVAAEDQLKARTAEIGVAIANRYPSIKLTGGAGFDSLALRTLLTEPAQFWQVGPTLAGPLFDGGRGEAAVEAAKAQAAGALADYRAQCITALRDVEDALVALRQESIQAKALQRAFNSSQTALHLADERYAHGFTNYLDVLDAQRSALQQKRTLCQVRGDRLVSTVQLIRALGGGWN